MVHVSRSAPVVHLSHSTLNPYMSALGSACGPHLNLSATKISLVAYRTGDSSNHFDQDLRDVVAVLPKLAERILTFD